MVAVLPVRSSLNALSGKKVTPSGTITLESVMQPANGEGRVLLFQFLGVVIVASDVPWKTYEPIVLILSGKVMLVIPLQFSNALFPIFSTVPGMVTEDNNLQSSNVE